MDQTNIVINTVRPLDSPKIEIETNNGKKYICDLSKFSKIGCFPKDQDAWSRVSITTHGFHLTWESRFEIHVLQAIDWAVSDEDIRLHA